MAPPTESANQDDIHLIKSSAEEEEKKDDVMLFQAKDGIYYPTYLEQRAANIRYNEQKLKSIGLGGSFRKPAPIRSSPSISRKRLSLSHKNNEDDPTGSPAEPLRKSGRLRHQPVIYEPLSSNEIQLKKRKIARMSDTSKSAPSLKSGAMTNTTIASADRQMLQTFEGSAPTWLSDMELYLNNVETLSRANLRSVMRQVEKLVTGVGITYKHWEEHVYFHRDAPISLADDMDNLYYEALEFEIEHGRDLGNGTVVGHACVCVCVASGTFLLSVCVVLQFSLTLYKQILRGLFCFLRMVAPSPNQKVD